MKLTCQLHGIDHFTQRNRATNVKCMVGQVDHSLYEYEDKYPFFCWELNPKQALSHTRMRTHTHICKQILHEMLHFSKLVMKELIISCDSGSTTWTLCLNISIKAEIKENNVNS